MENIKTVSALEIELPIRTYRKENILTYADIAGIHQIINPRQYFMNDKDTFEEGKDYYIIPLSKYRKLYDAPAGRGNPHIPVVLFTKSGYSILSDLFGKKNNHEVRDYVLQNYFVIEEPIQEMILPTVRKEPKARKEVVTDNHTVNILKALLGTISDAEIKIRSLESRLEKMEGKLEEEKEDSTSVDPDQVSNMEKKFDEFYSEVRSLLDFSPSNRVDLQSAAGIAAQLGIYSTTNKPHAKLINAIAARVGMPIYKKEAYENDLVLIIPEREEHATYWKIRYTPKGIGKIREWYKANYKNVYYEEKYIKTSKYAVAGEIKKQGLKVGEYKYNCVFR